MCQDKTRGDVYKRQLEPFINGIAEQIIAKPHIKEKQFSYKKLIEEKCIVYIIIPETKEQFKVFGTTIIKKLYNPLMEYASKQPNNKLPITIYLPWEEMALYSKVYNVDDWLSIMRGRGMLTDLILSLIHIYYNEENIISALRDNDVELFNVISKDHINEKVLDFFLEDLDEKAKSKYMFLKNAEDISVSYTHLDVYKRQVSKRKSFRNFDYMHGQGFSKHRI